MNTLARTLLFCFILQSIRISFADDKSQLLKLLRRFNDKRLESRQPPHQFYDSYDNEDLPFQRRSQSAHNFENEEFVDNIDEVDRFNDDSQIDDAVPYGNEEEEENEETVVETEAPTTATVTEQISVAIAQNSHKPSHAKLNSHNVQIQDQPTLKERNDADKAVAGISDFMFIVIVSACAAVAVLGIVGAGICFYKLQKNNKAAADTEYPAYGVTGPNKDNTSPSGDRKLAQSAQMYHYQHQKQQMIALEKAGTERNQSASDVDSEEENEEGDYTVYECPGLAPTGEMEVKNPLFNEQTPTSPSTQKKNNETNSVPEKESTKM